MQHNRHQLCIFPTQYLPVTVVAKPVRLRKSRRCKCQRVASLPGSSGKRLGSFDPAMRSPEQDAAIVRGVMMTRLDNWADDQLRAMCDEYSFTDNEFLRFYGNMIAAMFPEEFAEPDEPIERPGILPTVCSGVGVNRLRSFAKLCELSAGRAV